MPIPEMREGESCDDYKLRYIGLHLTPQELDDKANEAWYARRERMRLNKLQSKKASDGDQSN